MASAVDQSRRRLAATHASSLCSTAFDTHLCRTVLAEGVLCCLMRTSEAEPRLFGYAASLASLPGAALGQHSYSDGVPAKRKNF